MINQSGSLQYISHICLSVPDSGKVSLWSPVPGSFPLSVPLQLPATSEDTLINMSFFPILLSAIHQICVSNVTRLRLREAGRGCQQALRETHSKRRQQERCCSPYEDRIITVVRIVLTQAISGVDTLENVCTGFLLCLRMSITSLRPTWCVLIDRWSAFLFSLLLLLIIIILLQARPALGTFYLRPPHPVVADSFVAPHTAAVIIEVPPLP